MDRRVYADTEATARGKRPGLWSDSSPLPPWNFRYGTGTADVAHKYWLQAQGVSDVECPLSLADRLFEMSGMNARNGSED